MKYTQNDDLLIPELFDAQPESVVWFEAVYSGNQRADGNSLDFEVSYCNNAACKFLNVTKEALIGQRLLFNSILDEASTTLIFQQSAEVYKSALPLEFTYFNQHLNKYFNVSRSKVKNGVLSVTRDITQQYLLQKKA
jgi:PAS domain-containing protein